MRGVKQAQSALLFASQTAETWQGRRNNINSRRRAHATTEVAVQRMCFSLEFRAPPNCPVLGAYQPEGLCRERYCLKGLNACPVNRAIRQRLNDVVSTIPPNQMATLGPQPVAENLAEGAEVAVVPVRGQGLIYFI